MFEEFAFPYQKRIVEAVHRAGARTKLHICGNTSAVLPQMIETGSDILDLDWMVDIGSAKRLLQDKTTILCGNYDPVAVLLQGSPEKIARRKLLLIFGRLRSSARYARGKSARRCGRARSKDAKRIKKKISEVSDIFFLLLFIIPTL